MQSRICHSVFICFLLLTFNSFGQEVSRDSLPFTIVERIDASNKYLVDSVAFPDWYELENHLIENVALHIDTSWWNSEIVDILNQWKVENRITDDGEENEYFGVIKSVDNQFAVKKLVGIVHYLFEETGGGYFIKRTIEVEGVNIGEVISLFDPAIELNEKELEMHLISPANPIDLPRNSSPREHPLEKNVKFNFSFNTEDYELIYSADFSQNGFSFQGFGTIDPTYFNVELELVNRDSGVHQALYKFPHDHGFNISEIIIGDIDSDSKPDIIYKISDDLCIRRLVFLSSMKGSNPLMGYVGQTEVSCEGL